LRERARRMGVSPASLCHVAWGQVVGRTSGRDDVVFGTVIFGRMQAQGGSDRAMGLFINTLPVRMKLGEEKVEECIRKTHVQLAELMRHEHASLALAQRCSGIPAPAPVFTSVLNYRHNAGAQKVRREGKKGIWDGMRVLRTEERTNYPLTLSINDWGEDF